MHTQKLLKQVVFYVMAAATGYHVVKSSTILDPDHPISNPKDAWDQAKRLAGPKAQRIELPEWANPPDGERERSCYLCTVEISDVCHCGHSMTEHNGGQHECSMTCDCKRFVSKDEPF